MTRLTAVLVALVLASGCAGTPHPAPSPTPTIASSKDLTIGFGSVGPATIGMTLTQAKATGLFDGKGPDPVDGCGAPPLTWKKPFRNVDVLTDGKRIVSIGVSGPGPQTEQGIAVGSTLDAVTSAYPGLIGPEPAGYGQTGAYVKRSDGWIGFLFNAEPGATGPLTQVLFIEVAQGKKPGLMRDGC